MSLFAYLYHRTLRPITSFLVKEKSIPENPREELHYHTDVPLLYLLPSSHPSELLILSNNCLKHGLPDPLINNTIYGRTLPRYLSVDPRKLRKSSYKKKVCKIIREYYRLHLSHPNLKVHIIPVSVFSDRRPETSKKPLLKRLGYFQQLFNILFHGRDTSIRYAKAVLMRELFNKITQDEAAIEKLLRMAQIHFAKQRYSAKGPKISDRTAIFNKILALPAVKQVICDEAIEHNKSVEKITQQAVKILHEIAADVKPSTLQFASKLLKWLWKKLYQDIKINNAKVVRELSINGHEIVYIPNHRSHIDYLLLSYVLYYQGLATPYIASGINLNFFPVGKLFRNCGAFFIRRSFRGDKLYATLFKNYLAELFHRGYPVEYFIEGGRSRTGRLLPPKMGMMAMTLEAFLQSSRSITIVPVYIGYDNVLEVDTYIKELKGAKKERENSFLIFRALKKLRNLGKGFVTFGEPITLNSYINEHYPDWKKNYNGTDKPLWFNQAVENIANQTITNINKASAISPKNIVAAALLASRQSALGKTSLIAHIDSYLSLFKAVKYADEITMPQQNGAQILHYLSTLPRSGLIFEKDSFGEIVRLDRTSAVLMTYDRNNISHLLIIPSLIAKLIIRYQSISLDRINRITTMLYPFIKKDLFLHFSLTELPLYVEKIVENFVDQGFIQREHNLISLQKEHIERLQLHASLIKESIQRYFIGLSLLKRTDEFHRELFEQQIRNVAHRLSILNGINAPEYFDPVLFSNFSQTLLEQGYIDDKLHRQTSKTSHIYKQLSSLIDNDIELTIEGMLHKE